MANYQQLKQSVSDVIKTNGDKKITGAIMQNTLLTIINTIGANMQFAGVADISTNPGTPDQNLFWIASTPGTYVNFGKIVLNPGESAIIKWANNVFTKQILGLSTDERIEQVIEKYSTYKRGYLKKVDGNIGDYPIFFTKESYIELMQGETSITYIGEIFHAAAAICFYDNEKNHISSLPARGIEIVKKIYDAEIPTNAKYIRYTSKFGLSLNIYTNARQIDYMPFDDIENIRATAKNAQATADNAQASADNAQATAENAQASAENAQATADNAQASAENAQASAENAQASAENAQASADNAQTTAENAQTTAEEIKNDLAVVKKSLDGSNLDGESRPEKLSYFGTLFYENNTPAIYEIKQIVYTATKTFSNNKLILFDYLESKNKMKVVNIVDIQDAVEGENTIDIKITIKKGQALYILGNNLFRVGESGILGVTNVLKRLNITTPDTLKVGDILSVTKSVYYAVKSIRLIGSYRDYLTVEDVNKLIDDKNPGGEFGKITNYLKGKVLSVTGGSEAAGYSIGKTNTYGNLIAARNGMTINNYAIDGRKLITGGQTSLVNTYQEIALNSDYILVQIGFNDNFSAIIEDDSVDTATFKGAFNVLVQGLQSRYPTAKIGFIEPYYFGSLRHSAWMEERCKFYHIQCIDGTEKSGLRYDCDEQAVYFIDGARLTKLGHERMSYIYEQFMRGL